MSEVGRILEEIEELRQKCISEVANTGSRDAMISCNAYNNCWNIIHKYLLEDWISCKTAYPPVNSDKNFIITDEKGKVRYNLIYGYVGDNKDKPGFYFWNDWDDRWERCEAVAWRYELEPYRSEKKEENEIRAIDVIDLAANAFIETMDTYDIRFFSYKTLNSYAYEAAYILKTQGINLQIYNSRDITDRLLGFKRTQKYFSEITENGIKGIRLNPGTEKDDLIMEYRGYTDLRVINALGEKRCLDILKEEIKKTGMTAK